MLGPTSTKKWQATLRPFETTTGRKILVPSGVGSKDPFTYYDLLHLKQQGINPNDIPPELHQGIHDRMLATMSPEGEVSPERMMNQLLLAQISPNQPLTPNELAVARSMVKGPEDLDRLGAARPQPAQGPVQEGAVRRPGARHHRALRHSGAGPWRPRRLGIARLHHVPQVCRDLPEGSGRVRFRGDLEHGADETEKWASYVERLMTQVKGLSAKTGSFGGVWQSPRDAAISAVDRHMLDIIGEGLFESAEEATRFRDTLLTKFNATRRARGLSEVETLDQMAAGGGKKLITDARFSYMNSQNKSPIFRLKRTGEINPEVPKHLAEEEWIEEPLRAHLMGPRYRRGVGVNQKYSKRPVRPACSPASGCSGTSSATGSIRTSASIRRSSRTAAPVDEQ